MRASIDSSHSAVSSESMSGKWVGMPLRMGPSLR